MALEREMETFRRELPNLLRTESNRDKFVLIHKDKVDSIWDTVEEALDAGYERIGLEVFLVKKITEHEKPIYFSRNLTRALIGRDVLNHCVFSYFGPHGTFELSF